MDLRDDARSMQDDLVDLRRDLHQVPEVGLDLPRTQERVLEALQGLPLEVSTGTDTTSVTAVLRGGAVAGGEPTTVLLRGDMDGLPVGEETGLDYAAGNGNMHACGHDLHTTALVGAARLLSQHRDTLAGDVVFMFQPGEEGYDGAGVMLREGVLDAAGRRVDHAYGLHVLSTHVPGGVFSSRADTLMAASYELDVTVRGAGGHGSSPHLGRDPVQVLAEMITSLQTMVTRRFDVFDPVVVSVGMVRAGTARNVIPDSASFQATIRAFSREAEERLVQLIPPLMDSIAQAHGVDAEVRIAGQYPVTVNDGSEVTYGAGVIGELIGDERYVTMPNPTSGSEDFSRVLAEVPGAFIFLGACPPDQEHGSAAPNHSPRAVFDDSILGDAAAVYAALAVGRLTPTR
ncbi:amidohydrolase [Nocardioides albidus]|uniref:Amidohydrolase n=1 Tax=Nocardioides albidus TaxID=1517589 RepID=A0A5C4VL87_9ACTN|nr:M20 family metallopeptidase [Nocardioides albidus]TNM36521.1 amidohydrolase [Nocardioides albidus]